MVNLLVHEAFLRTERGRGGGIALAVPATEILLGDVLRRVQPDLVRHVRRDHLSGHNANLLALAAIVGAAEARFLTFMDRYSIADLISDSVNYASAGKRVSHLPFFDCWLVRSACETEADCWHFVIEQTRRSSLPV